MNNPRPGTAGATRTCPHCKTTILESAAVCPACKHHLRFDPNAGAAASETITPLRVEGSIRHPADSGAWEYCVVLSIRNDRGDEIKREVVGVGAMQPNEQRTFTLAVEVMPTTGKGGRRNSTRH